MSHQECTNGRSPDAFREDVRTWPSQRARSEEHTSELQSPCNLVCRLLLEKITIRPCQDLRLYPPAANRLDERPEVCRGRDCLEGYSLHVRHQHAPADYVKSAHSALLSML